MLTLVEAAGLSGVPTERLRALIESGHLAASAVRLEHGSVYLVESEQLERLSARPEEPGSPRAPDGSDPLAEALAGLQAALARRTAARSSAVHEARPANPSPGPETPRRPACGLSQPELRRLAARVERLLGP